MAQKGGYPGYPQQPPPPAAGYVPPPPGYPTQGYAPPPYSAQPQATTNVYVHQTQPVVRGRSNRTLFGSMLKEIDKVGSAIGREADRAANAIDKHLQATATGSVLRGLFGQIGHELNVLGKTVSREVDWAAGQVNKAVATSATGNILSLFQTGNIIQLVSRSNGGCLEIVQGAGGLVVDGRGREGDQHATWTVVNEGNNQIRLYNRDNYLAIINGNTVLITMSPGMMHGVETKFQLMQSDQFVYIESMKERGHHIGILPNGDLKSALACRKEMHSQFAVRLAYSPYPQTTVTTVTTVHKR